LDHCPTGCIRPDRTIDAGRCISYLTIEHKGRIPPELRSKIGNWVFGCDICQQVCPWNQQPNGATEIDPPLDPAFSPRSGLLPDLLADDLTLDAQAFNARFKGNPIKRSKRRGYLRNLVITLGNRKDSRSIQALSAALKDSEPLVRSHAAWALGQIGGEESIAPLRKAKHSEEEPSVLEEIRAALNAHKAASGD
jgi:epoxyqueuosine reductase